MHRPSLIAHSMMPFSPPPWSIAPANGVRARVSECAGRLPACAGRVRACDARAAGCAGVAAADMRSRVAMTIVQGQIARGHASHGLWRAPGTSASYPGATALRAASCSTTALRRSVSARVQVGAGAHTSARGVNRALPDGHADRDGCPGQPGVKPSGRGRRRACPVAHPRTSRRGKLKL